MTYCPVCGWNDSGIIFTQIENAKIRGISAPLPDGKLVALQATLANGDEVILIAFENEGGLLEHNGTVRVTLPAGSLPKGARFILVDANGESIEIPVDFFGSIVFFDLNFASVDGRSPVLLVAIHVVNDGTPAKESNFFENLFALKQKVEGMKK